MRQHYDLRTVQIVAMILGWKWCLSHSEGPQTQCFHGTFASLMVSLIHQFLLKFDIFFQTADRERACLCHMAQLPFTAEPEKQTSTKTNKQTTSWHHTFWYNKFRPTKANPLGLWPIQDPPKVPLSLYVGSSYQLCKHITSLIYPPSAQRIFHVRNSRYLQTWWVLHI